MNSTKLFHHQSNLYNHITSGGFKCWLFSVNCFPTFGTLFSKFGTTLVHIYGNSSQKETWKSSNEQLASEPTIPE